MKELILDYSKWRSGGLEGCENTLGKGITKLLNPEGYMCCLGQISLQLNPELTEKDILGVATPSGVFKYVPILVSGEVTDGKMEHTYNTDFSTRAMRINDDEKITPEEKVKKLTALFATAGYTLKVINKP